MITIKFDINSDNSKFILNKQMDYSYAFRKLYKYFDQINNQNYLNYLKDRFNLSVYELNCLKIDVKSKINQIKTNKEKLSNEIITISNEISKLNKIELKSRNETRKLFKLNKKLTYKNKSLCKDITFGGKHLLQEISFLNNNKPLNEIKIKNKTKIYKERRILPINYVGSLNDLNSNRYFNFDFINNSINYKPNKKTKINITYDISGKYKLMLLKLQSAKDLNILPISVKLTSKYICLSFDEELLNGFGFDEKSFKNEIKMVDNKDVKKQIFIKHKKIQNEKKLNGKIKNRYCGIDLNPEFIGVTIMESDKIIDRFTFDLSNLLKKSNQSSDNNDTIYINNKRKYEIGVIYKKLFVILNHYKVAYFVMEDLNFKSNLDSTEANRKTKNVWNLNLQQNLITKHCNLNGIQLVDVNPCYSSFIGNIMFNDFDPANASTEICRRGSVKYIKGNNFYPILTNTILDTVVVRFNLSDPDVQRVKDCKNWISLYKLFKEMGFKYRWQLNSIDFNSFSQHNKANWSKK